MIDTGPLSAADLFAPTPQQLVDDAQGGIRYLPAVVAAATADAWFASLHDGTRWQSERRPMYSRMVDVPRLMAAFALADPALPEVLQQALALVQLHAPAPYTHVGLNLYRDGRDSVAPHNDKLPSIVADWPIALLSLGATRRMEIRDKLPPRRTRRVALDAGSLFVMSHDSQRHYDHGIPKTSEPVGVRISAVFRVRPPLAVRAPRASP